MDTKIVRSFMRVSKAVLLVSVLLTIPWNRVSVTAEQSERTPLHVGGLFEFTGHWWSQHASFFPRILEHAFTDVRNHSSILRDFEIHLDVKDTEGQNGNAAKQMIELIEVGPPKLAIFGPSVSQELTVTGQIAPFYKIIEMSYVASTSSTVDQGLFPTLFSVNPITMLLNPLRIEMMNYFGWSRVGSIAYQDDMSTSQINAFHGMLEEYNHTLVTSAVISERRNIKNIISMFKQFDVRIIMGAFRSKLAPEIFCQAYKQGVYGSHVWILTGATMYDNWIQNADLSDINCTREQIIEASDGHFTLSYRKLRKSQTETISGKTGTEVIEELGEVVSGTPYKLTSYAGWIYDAGWAFALGIDNSLKYMEERNLSIYNYTYTQDYLDSIIQGMSEVKFDGISGPVSFDETGKRVAITYIEQNFNDTRTDVAHFDVLTGNLTWTVPADKLWPGGIIPKDRYIYRDLLVPISVATFGFTLAMSVTGCVLTICFLSFNFYYRHNRSIKMSSPKINNVIMVGCFIMYVQVMTTAYDLKFADEARGHYSCMTRVWLMSIGFTTLFGAMFSKTYRVYVIFKDSQFKTKMIKDFHLFGMIGAFLLIDCLVLCPWTILDPLRNERHVILSKDSSDQNVIVSRIHLHCYKEHQGYWFAAIYSYKGLLLAFGAFLAWETRKVKVPALNDSAYIGACIYNVVVICIFSVPLAHMLPIERANLSFILSSCLILFCTTLCQCILFVPKIQARNQVHGRFLTTETASHDMSRTAIGSTAFTATSQVMVSSAPSASHVEYESKELEELKADNSELRMQIENDSAALAKLKKELLEVTGNVQLYKEGNGHVVFTEITEDIPEKPPTANGLSSHSSDI